MIKDYWNQAKRGAVRFSLLLHGRSENQLHSKQEMLLNESDAWSVLCKHAEVLQPRAKHIVCGKENLGNSSTLVMNLTSSYTSSGHLCDSESCEKQKVEALA